MIPHETAGVRTLHAGREVQAGHQSLNYWSIPWRQRRHAPPAQVEQAGHAAIWDCRHLRHHRAGCQPLPYLAGSHYLRCRYRSFHDPRLLIISTSLYTVQVNCPESSTS